MKEYKVEITNRVLNDMEEIYYYIIRSAKNGYHCKKPNLSLGQIRLFAWRKEGDSNPWRLLHLARFPSVCLRPAQPSFHG